MAIYAYGSRGYGGLDYKPFSQPEWYNLAPIQQDYYRDNPEAVYGSFARGLNNQYGGRFTDFANNWVRRMYGEFQGKIGETPDSDLSFIDYVRQRQPSLRGDYIQSLGTRPIVRPTRIVR